jgi:hypothetical protein
MIVKLHKNRAERALRLGEADWASFRNRFQNVVPGRGSKVTPKGQGLRLTSALG